jgi:hypothetical protein
MITPEAPHYSLTTQSYLDHSSCHTLDTKAPTLTVLLRPPAYSILFFGNIKIRDKHTLMLVATCLIANYAILHAIEPDARG